MTLTELAQITGAGGALLAIGNILWTWHAQSQAPSKALIADLDCKVDEHDRRLTKVEADMQHLPSKDDVNQVKIQMEKMLGQMGIVQTEMQGTGRTLRRLEDHLRGEKA